MAFFVIFDSLEILFLQLDIEFLQYLLGILTCVRMWMCVDGDDTVDVDVDASRGRHNQLLCNLTLLWV